MDMQGAIRKAEEALVAKQSAERVLWRVIKSMLPGGEPLALPAGMSRLDYFRRARTDVEQADALYCSVLAELDPRQMTMARAASQA